MKILEKILDFIFPRSEIQKKLDKITPEELFDTCPKIKTKNEKNITIFSYKSPLIKEAIWYLKYNNNKKMAQLFSKILNDSLLEVLFEKHIYSNFTKPILIPIPISAKKLKKKGFNQTDHLAKEMTLIDKNKNFIFKTGVLIKIKDTIPQTKTKNKKERLENIKNSFDVPENKIKDIKKRNIILLDDVTTTGATLNEAEKILKKYGAKKIIRLTIAS